MLEEASLRPCCTPLPWAARLGLVARETWPSSGLLQIVLTEMYYDGFHRSFSDVDDLDTVQESDCIFAFETPEIFWPEGILSQRGMWTCGICGSGPSGQALRWLGGLGGGPPALACGLALALWTSVCLGLPSYHLSFFCPVQIWEIELGLPLWASLLKLSLLSSRNPRQQQSEPLEIQPRPCQVTHLCPGEAGERQCPDNGGSGCPE